MHQRIQMRAMPDPQKDKHTQREDHSDSKTRNEIQNRVHYINDITIGADYLRSLEKQVSEDKKK